MKSKKFSYQTSRSSTRTMLFFKCETGAKKTDGQKCTPQEQYKASQRNNS
uniref:Uncharacterized protein n=1 Tax=Rhizophora mucronata TaxID=61149 RepID=A0A2P2PWQ1_RHIMU